LFDAASDVQLAFPKATVFVCAHFEEQPSQQHGTLWKCVQQETVATAVLSFVRCVQFTNVVATIKNNLDKQMIKMHNVSMCIQEKNVQLVHILVAVSENCQS